MHESFFILFLDRFWITDFPLGDGWGFDDCSPSLPLWLDIFLFVQALGGEESPHAPAFGRDAAPDGALGLLVP